MSENEDLSSSSNLYSPSDSEAFSEASYTHSSTNSPPSYTPPEYRASEKTIETGGRDKIEMKNRRSLEGKI